MSNEPTVGTSQTGAVTTGVGSQPPMSHDELMDLARLLFQHIEQQSALADTKAQLIAAADAVLTAAIAAMGRGVVLTLSDPKAQIAGRLAAGFTILAFLSVLLSFYFALVATRPKLRPLRKQKQTLLYFAHIVNWSEEEFIRRFAAQSRADVEDSLVAQVYGKSKVAQLKFTAVRRSVTSLIVAVLIFAVSQGCLAFVR